MTLYRYSGTVRDQYQRPIEGALVAVSLDVTGDVAALFDDDGDPIGNPITTGELGDFAFNVEDAGNYQVQYFYGGRLVYTETVYIGFGTLPADIAAILSSDEGAAQIGTSSGDSVQAALDGKLSVSDVSLPQGPWSPVVATAGQTVFTFAGSAGIAANFFVNSQPVTFGEDYTRSGDAITLLVAASAGDHVSIEGIPTIGNVPGLTFNTEVIDQAIAGIGTATPSANGLMSSSDKVSLDALPGNVNVIKDSRPLNLLDYCTSDAQRAAVMAGTLGIDIPMALALPAAASLGNRPIILPPRGNFVTTAGATIVNPTGVPIYGNGSTITKVGTGALFKTGAQVDPVMGGARLIDGTTPRGTRTVSVNSNASLFSPGQWVAITDRTRIFPLAGNYRGELKMVQSVDATANTITFWTPTKYDYLGGAVGNGYARVVAAPVVSGAAYRDLNIIMDPTISLTVRGNNAFDCRWLLNATLENIRISRFVEVGVYLNACVGCRVDVTAYNGGSATTGTGDPTSTEGLPGFSYGVAEFGPCLGNQINIIATNIRHAYSTGSVPSTGGQPLDYGEPIGTVVDGIANEPINAGFDTHEAGMDIEFRNIKVNGGHYVGAQIRSRNTTVTKLEVNNTVGCALWIRGGATTANDNAYANQTIIGTVIANRTNLGTSFDGIDWRERGAVCDEASGTRGDWLVAINVGGPALTMYRNGGNSGGYWRNVQVINSCQLAAVNKFVIHIPSAFSTPIVIENIHNVGDGKEVNIIRGTGASGTVRNFMVSSGSHTGQAFLLTGGMTLANSLPNITGLQGILDDFETRISALEGA